MNINITVTVCRKEFVKNGFQYDSDCVTTI